jgi:hypothetical protein
MTKGFDQGRTNFGRKGCRRARSFPSVLYHVPSGEGWKKARQRSQQRVAGPGAILDLEQVPNEVSGTPRESVPDDPVSRMKAVEAALFVAREPLSARRLAALADLADPTEARTIARCLNEHYDQEGYSFRIEEVAGGMQILSRPQFAGWLPFSVRACWKPWRLSRIGSRFHVQKSRPFAELGLMKPCDN